MSKVLSLLKNLTKDEDGTALVEYSILLGVIAVAVIAFATGVGTWSSGKWAALCAQITCP
jgi:pilus assembly protein Flp/PilA